MTLNVLVRVNRLFSDLRHGARVLARTPGVTATALVALALAIGANTAMFSVLDAVLLRPLPFEDPDRVVMVWEDASRVGFPRNTPAPANWVDWRIQNTVFAEIAATRGGAYNLTGDGPPERLLGRKVTASFWSVLGSKPALGRTFTEAEDKASASVAVIGYGLWKRRFGGDPSVIGRRILLDDAPFTVIGVMPAAFAFPNRRSEVFTPAAFSNADLARRGSHFLQCVARLKPGVSLAQAQAEMKLIAQRLEERYPGTNRGVGAVVVPIRDQVAGESRTGLLVLFAASGFVLLIACANIANLLLAKASSRNREIAVRTALGASRGTIIRQLLTESVLLAGCGALLGIGLARVSMVLLEKLVPTGMAAGTLALDWKMLAFTAGVTLATGVVFGVFPALLLGRVDVQESLKQGGRTLAGGHGSFTRQALVVSQTALGLALLTGAGLLIRTLDNLGHTDLGLKTDHLLTIATDLPRARYAEHGKQLAFVTAAVERVRQIPGVLAAGYTSDLPLTARGNTSGYLLRTANPVESNTQDALFRVVTADFLQTIGARLREGRFPTEDDRAGTLPVVLINETFANRHWPGQPAVGKQIAIDREQMAWLTVIGVVKEIRERGINIDTKPAIYMPVAQSAGYWPVPGDLAIRTAVDPTSVLSAVRQAIWSIDPDQPISDVRTMTDVVDEELGRERQQTALLSIFALLALVLAGTGVYGVISCAVSQRRREFGIRVAVGASAANLLGMVMRQSSGMIAGGLLAGVLLSVAGATLLRSILHGVQPHDVWNLATAALTLGAIAVCAGLIAARPATRIDPAAILREE